MTAETPYYPKVLSLLRAMRPTQWTKNLAVLAAFFFAFGDRTQSVSLHLFTDAALAAGLFCLVSSGVYLLNDIHDKEADRLHPLKRFRPVASGQVSESLAKYTAAGLLTLGTWGAFRLSPSFAVIVGTYILLQFIYSQWLKDVALVDVFIIATGFVLRATGGGLVINVVVSPWLLLCAFLLALFLALCKRRHEKLTLDNCGSEHRPSLGDYDNKLLDQLVAVVSAATIVSYSIYTLWPDTTRKFGSSYLSLTIPLVIYGIFRYLDLVYRREGGGHPETTLLTDKPLLVDLALYGLVVLGVFFFSR